jgi:hypothetical protein
MDQGTAPHFVVCLRNDGYTLDLALHKVYEVVPDPSAERSGWMRVVDETGEDYLYPTQYFGPLDPSDEAVPRRRESDARPSTGG